MQNDFAARADWCVSSYTQANHPPVVKLAHSDGLKPRPGTTVTLSAKGSSNPDSNELNYQWWHYRDAGTYDGTIEIRNAGKQEASFIVPDDAAKNETIHVICMVKDGGTRQ